MNLAEYLSEATEVQWLELLPLVSLLMTWSEMRSTHAVIYRIPMKSYNLEIRDKEVFEIDLVLLAPVRVCSRYQGNSRSHRSLWLNGILRIASPTTLKAETTCQDPSSLISDTNRMYPNLRQIHVQAVVLMTADDVHIVDRDGRDEDYVTTAI